MYEEFIKETSKFIFAENKPEKADIIFVPGNGYSQMAERAAQLYAKKICSICTAKWKIQYFYRQIWRSTDWSETVQWRVSDGMGIFKGCTDEEWCAGGCCSEGRSGDIYLGKCKVFQKSYRSVRY